MLDPQAIIDQISAHLRRELTPAVTKQGLALSISLPLPEVRLRSLPPITGDWFFWERPTEDEIILGMGYALHLTATGQDRLGTLNRRMREIRQGWRWIDPEQTGISPMSYLCFAFSPNDRMEGPWSSLPNSGLFLPELTLRQSNNLCVASFSANLEMERDTDSIQQRWTGLLSDLIAALIRPQDTPGCKTTLTEIATSSDRTEWRRLIAMAQAAISAGRMEKLVPARHQRVQAQRRFDAGQLMDTLNYLYPNSMLLATRIGKRVFVSATPERLISLCNGVITCDAIAGTIHRSAVEAKDRELGDLLLSDPKIRHEHQLVVDGIKASLGPICTGLDYQIQPSLIRLRNLQHLFTEIRGRLKPDVDLLQAADRLHPTAAVNGHPSAEAGQWLKQNSHFERGWYTGAAGWIDYQGNGELAVLLRCALLDNEHADLYAGAGITGGSDADAEYDETELKFRVMLEALENA